MPQLEFCQENNGPKIASVHAGDPAVIPSVQDLVYVPDGDDPHLTSMFGYLAASFITTSKAISQSSSFFARSCNTARNNGSAHVTSHVKKASAAATLPTSSQLWPQDVPVRPTRGPQPAVMTEVLVQL